MKNLLVPTDLTDCTSSTLRYAISLALKSNTKLYFYHAYALTELHMKEYAEVFIKGIFNELGIHNESFPFEVILENVHFSNSLLKEAIKKYAIDLVIMGASHEGLKTTFFGSHVSDLINEVSCPVLSVPHGYISQKIENIGYATELFDLSERLKEIVPFARIFNATIEAFHVYPVFPENINLTEYDVDTSLSLLKKENNYSNINLYFIKTPFDNEPVTGIRKFLKSHHPDMLIMCHKPRGIFDKLIMDSGTTTSVVKISPVPLLALNQNTACKIM